MPNRYGSDMPAGEDYEFGFNGMTKDNEIRGNGNSYDFGARMLDVRIGRFISKDPKADLFPGWSPYNLSQNSPIYLTDAYGEAPVGWWKRRWRELTGNGFLNLADDYEESPYHPAGNLPGNIHILNRKDYENGVIFEITIITYEAKIGEDGITEFEMVATDITVSFAGDSEKLDEDIALEEGGFKRAELTIGMVPDFGKGGPSLWKKWRNYRKYKQIDKLRKIKAAKDAANAANKITKFNSAKIMKQSSEHIFSKKHIRNGIMDLGSSKSAILNNASSVITKNLDKLKEGQNAIETVMNGHKATIKVFVKEGQVLSTNVFKGSMKVLKEDAVNVIK